MEVGSKVLFTLTFTRQQWAPTATEVMPVPNPGATLHGTVKNYGANSGYGFIKPMDDSPFTHDLYFNHKDFVPACKDNLRNKLQGDVVKFNVRLTVDGMAQAKNIELVSQSEDAHDEDQAVPTNKSCWGYVKSYRTQGGYGFIDCPELGRDVWFPRRELQGDALTDDMRGMEVVFELWVQGDDRYQARAVTTVLPGAAYPQPASIDGELKRSLADELVEDGDNTKRQKMS